MDTINDNLSLTVINDGDGSQCGASYKTRCQAFLENTAPEVRSQLAKFWVAKADEWMVSRGYQSENATIQLIQACEVAEYYAEHVCDLVGGA